MLHYKHNRYGVIVNLAIMFALIPVVGVGFVIPKVSGTLAGELATTLVPDVNLDVYLLINQGHPPIDSRI